MYSIINMRLNKYISQSGYTSRRKADVLIQAGQVLINGKKVTTLGVQVDSAKDIVTVQGKHIQMHANHVYLAFHKPVGYVCTHARFQNQQSIFDLLSRKYQRLKIAGRLDKDSSGLLILSDDGAFIERLTHPRFEHEKEYEIVTAEPLTAVQLSQLRQGVYLEEGIAKVDRMVSIGNNQYGLVLHQGWKRQIRRMLEAVGGRVVSLQRVRVGRYQLGGLPPGRSVEISKQEVLEKPLS